MVCVRARVCGRWSGAWKAEDCVWSYARLARFHFLCGNLFKVAEKSRAWHLPRLVAINVFSGTQHSSAWPFSTSKTPFLNRGLSLCPLGPLCLSSTQRYSLSLSSCIRSVPPFIMLKASKPHSNYLSSHSNAWILNKFPETALWILQSIVFHDHL